MINKNKHNREHTINFVRCNDYCPKGEQVILFKKDAKLREHTVKHLISKEGRARIIRSSITEKDIQQIRKMLKDIGCPYYVSNYENPPCFNHQKNCPRDNCLKIDYINKLEDIYKGIVHGDLTECAGLPRYACYYEKNEKKTGWMLSALSSKMLIIHSSWMKEYKKYNVTSCYSRKQWQSFVEFRDKQVEKIINNAKEDSIIFCNRKNWGFDDELVKKMVKKHKKPLTQMQIAFMKASMLMDERKTG